jgi:myosin heavy subunit
MDTKSWYWAPHPTEGYMPVKIKQTAEGFIARIPQTGEQFIVQKEQLMPAHESSLEPCDNLVALQELSEPALLHNLRTRFSQDIIYTWISSILISVNPFKQLPIYSTHVMSKYRESLAQHRVMAPHVFTVADNAYKSLLRGVNGAQVAIVISGESGAGKSECMKVSMSYLAEIAASTSGTSSGASSAIADRVLSTNPILEAFGNAKTVRNNNSSRFGKLIKLCFSTHAEISGAHIESYLLEKSRIVQQSPGERNYHIFYQLFVGLSEKEKKELFLTHPSDFNITQGNFDDSNTGDKKAAQKLLSSYIVDGIDDREEFYRTQKAFEQIGISPDEQKAIYRITAGCLHLGNVEFNVKGSDACEISSSSKNSLNISANLLGLNVDTLSKALVSQLKQMGKDFVTTNKNKVTAEAGLAACVKSIYSQQFDWLIQQMNSRLAPQIPSKSFIGILDIFGFEVFDVNSFEQLCINFTNEKMQSHFNQHVFKLELDEYKAEQLNLDVSSVSYVDNQPCLDLIENGRICILALCDEELRTPKGNDETLLDKMHQQLSTNKYYIKPKTKGVVFGIQHYAGAVDYTITNFMAKNKDQLDMDLANALASSSIQYMKNIMLPLTDAAKVATTLGKKFKTQLGDLMNVLNASEPHFIRCIKSNHLKIGDTFNGDMVLGQLRYLGLREVVLIRQQGYPIRRPFADFLQRYKLLLPAICGPQQAQQLLTSNNPLQMVKTILTSIDGTEKDWKLGKSKAFYRMQIQTKLEQQRDQALSAVVLELQTHIRCKLERERFLQRNQVLVMLRQAVHSNDLKQLDKVIDLAERISVNPNGNTEMSQLYRQCSEIRNKLSEQAEAANALKRAMGTKDIEMLLLAIFSTRNAFANVLGVKPSVVNVKSVKVADLRDGELVQQCPEYSQAITLVKKLQDFENSSQEASKTRDLSTAQYVVQLAKELQLAQGTIQRWENLYMQIKEEKKVQATISSKNSAEEYNAFKKNIQIAITNQCAVLLNVLLGRAQQQGFHHDPLYAQGRTLEQSLQISATTLAKELKFALESNDLDVIKYAIKVAVEKGFGAHDLVRQCKETLLILEQVNRVKKSLQDALISPKRLVLEHAISEADKLGGVILQSEEYSQAQKSLADMKEKQKKFNHRASIHARRSVIGSAPPTFANSRPGNMGGSIAEGDEDFDPDSLVGTMTGGDIWADASIDELHIALAEAESAGLDDAQVKLIKKHLNTLQGQKQALELLQNAVDASNIRMLETAIDRAEKAGIAINHDLLSRALALRSHLRDKKAARAGAGAGAAAVATLYGAPGENLLQIDDLGKIREVNIDKYIDPLLNIDWYTDSAYEIQRFPYLRTAAEFLKSNNYSENDKIAMFKHQMKEINNTMIQIEQLNTKHFTYDGQVGTSNHIDLNKLQSFISHSTSLLKSIQAYMFDRKLSFPESLIAELILTCQSYPFFRDEVYCMVIKQLTDNPHIPSLLQGWRLLSIISRYIAPSPAFFPYVLRYIYSHTPEALEHDDLELRIRLNPKMTAFEQTTLRNTARYALTMLPMTLKECILVAADLCRRNVEHAVHYQPASGAAIVGTTGQPVSSDKATSDGVGRYDQVKVQELIAVITGFTTKSMMPVLMHIYFPDDSAVALTVSPWDTPQTIVQRACDAVGVTDSAGLWLYENYKEKNFALLPYENPIDIQRVWLDKSQKKRKLFATSTKQSKFSRFRNFINDSLSSISEPNTIQGRNGLIVNKSGKRKIVIRRRTFFAPIQLSFDKLMNTLLFFQTITDVNTGLHHLHQESAAMLARMTQILLPNLRTFASYHDRTPPPPPSDDDDDDDDIPPPPPPQTELLGGPNNVSLISGDSVDIDEKLPLDPPQIDLVKKHAPQCPPNLLVGKNKITAKKFYQSVESVQLDLGLLSLEQYVVTVMQLPTFSANFFFLQQSFDPALPKDIILAVNQTGIFVLDGATRASLEQYTLMQTLGWSSGPNRLTLHVKLSKADKQGKTTRALRFDTERTSIGQEVCQLLMAYAKDFLEKMQAKTQA